MSKESFWERSYMVLSLPLFVASLTMVICRILMIENIVRWSESAALHVSLQVQGVSSTDGLGKPYVLFVAVGVALLRFRRNP